MALTLAQFLFGLPDLVAGVGMVALAVVLARLDFHSLVHRTFALYLVVRGTFQAIQVVEADPALIDYVSRVGGYFSLAVPFTLTAFAAAFLAAHARRPQAARLVGPILLLGVLAEVWYALDHAAYRVRGSIVATGPLYPLADYRLLIAAAFAAWLLHEASRRSPGAARTGMQVVGIGFLLEPVELGVSVLSLLWTDPNPVLFPQPGSATFWDTAGRPLTLLALGAGLLAARTLLGEALHGPSRRLGVAGLVLLGGAASLWFVVSYAGFAIATLAIPVAVAYALVHHRFLDLDLKLKRSVRVATVAAMFVLTYVVVGLAARTVLPPQEGEVVAFAGPALLLLAIGPLQRLGGHVAEAVFPGLEPTEAYLRARRREVYEAALEHALDPEGEVRRGEQARLDALRTRLGLGEQEHRAALAAARAGAARHALAPGGLFLDRYRVVGPLGRGGSGEVWLARDEQEGRDVAVKRLAPEHRRDALALARFDQEVRLSQALRHPHIVRVHGVELAGADVYLVLEYAAGGSLQALLDREGPLPEGEASRLAQEVAQGLGALHRRGIVHRDVKPSNVLLAGDGRALLADFTLAQEAVSRETVGATGPGRPAGTLAFMSPEQARGVRVGPASDVYSLGATLYAALTGRPPIAVEGLSDFEARLRLARDPPALPLSEASAALNEVLARALAKDPRDRYRDGAAFARALAGAVGLTPRGRRGGSGRRR